MQGKVTEISDWNVVLVLKICNNTLCVLFVPTNFIFLHPSLNFQTTLWKTLHHRLKQVGRLNRKEIVYLQQFNHLNKDCQPVVCLCVCVKEERDEKREIGSESMKRKNLDMKKGNLKTRTL